MAIMKQMTTHFLYYSNWNVEYWICWPPTNDGVHQTGMWQKIIHPSAGYWRFKRWVYVNGGWFVYKHETVLGEWNLGLR